VATEQDGDAPAIRLRLCVGASAGGHLNQLFRLLDAADSWPVEPDFYVTTLEQLASKFADRGRVYVIGECDREHPLRIVAVLFRSLRVAVRERPDAVVTTGSMPIALLCIWCKLLGAKIVWIDSIANTERLSMSGRLTRRFADLILSQWPEVATATEGVEYAGALV